MPVKFNDHSANERRRNAEVSYKDILTRRMTELNAGADAVQAATLRVFPNLFAAPSPIEAPVNLPEAPVNVTVEPIIEAISEEKLIVDLELSDQEKRLIAARLATAEAHHETAA